MLTGIMPQLSLFEEEMPTGRKVLPAPVDDSLCQTADKMPAAIRLGTSSWSFPGWKGILYDRGGTSQLLARHGLWAYAKHPLLAAAGIDRTFYAPITADDFAAYAADVGDDFRFLVKAHEYCTVAHFPSHQRYGERAGQDNPHFLDADYAEEFVVRPYRQGLGEKAGVLLFQFSPMDVGRVGGRRAFCQRLLRFLQALPSDLTCAVELRNRELFHDSYLKTLEETGTAHCLNIHPSMPPVTRQAEMSKHLGGPTVIRWMLHAGLTYESAGQRYHPYGTLVDADLRTRSAVANICRWAARCGRQVYVIANNKAEGCAPLTLFRLAEAIVGS
ncbi:MAG TPA: DUF72 domain-containing protein [Acidobacteriota bacterium]|nr:DUF72 domain-containing protein [Acidobacteriota bacterium]